ncbi:hypothetical protein PHMEG_00028337 [Phytophthora megakarya]|uniref:Uncharacterized protein n=1 Tax=Phytophthora megakarya TaxID=4795 RepID=A0A225V568_9STRA|nr:hypothetical protein PHMEG_00028337 [Phytophthora megakarya]
MCGSLTLPSIATCITPRATEKIETHRKKSSSRKSTTTGTGPSVRRNRSRDRQRLEILQLRAQAEVLEKRVTDMRDKQRERENDNTLWITNTIKGTPRHYQRHHRDSLLFDALKDLAKRHRKLRKDSEHENKSLRNVYRTQLTTIEMLKKLLQSQEKMKRSVRFTSQNYYVESYFDADENALVVMDRLSDALDSLHVSTDCVFQSNGLAAITSAFTQANMNQSTETVTNVEVLNCRVLPFDFRDVGKAYCHLKQLENLRYNKLSLWK